ncbi:MAG: hypothetical protein NBV63_01015 [Candidatus Pacebacteria bacterium]|nr:hypothetical protein [Candidatus Paceibacterota bacterium]
MSFEILDYDNNGVIDFGEGLLGVGAVITLIGGLGFLFAKLPRDPGAPSQQLRRALDAINQ